MLFGGRSRTGRKGSSQLRSNQERGRYDHRILGAPVRIALVIQPRTPQRIFARRSRDPDMVHAEIIVVIDIVERPAIGVGRIPPSRPVLLPGIAADSSAVIDGFRFEKAVGSRPLPRMRTAANRRTAPPPPPPEWPSRYSQVRPAAVEIVAVRIPAVDIGDVFQADTGR